MADFLILPLIVAVVILGVGLVIATLLARNYYHKWKQRQTNAYNLGSNKIRGEVYQHLGTFSMLGEYDQLMTLSTTAEQASLDLIGIKPDSVDFIELKKKGVGLRGPERKVQRLIEERKVRYIVKDVQIPEITVTDRALNQKHSARPYQPRLDNDVD